MRNAGPTDYKMGIARAMRRHVGFLGQVDAPLHHPTAFSYRYILRAPPQLECSLAFSSAGGKQLREGLFLAGASLSLSKAATGRGKAGTG